MKSVFVMRSVMIKEWPRTCPTTAQRLLHSLSVQTGGTEIGSSKRLSEYFSIFTEPVMRKESSPPLRTVFRKEWPPLRKCIQYDIRTGLIDLFVDRKYPWEDDGKEGEWFKLYEPYIKVETMRKELGIAKKFLHQVRTTRGYGVTCSLPLHPCSFEPVKDPERDIFVKESLQIALTHISKKTGKAYKPVKIENAVRAPAHSITFLTYDAKMHYSVPETFLSMVCYRAGMKEVMECLLKPDYDADWGANEDKVLLNYDDDGFN